MVHSQQRLIFCCARGVNSPWGSLWFLGLFGRPALVDSEAWAGWGGGLACEVQLILQRLLCKVCAPPVPLSSASATLALKLIWVLPFPTVTKAPRGLGSQRWGSHLSWEEGAGQQEFYQRGRGTDNVRTEPFLLLWQRAGESGMSLDKFLLN